MTRLTVAIFLFVQFTAAAQSAVTPSAATGYVYIDLNKNGIRDNHEEGVGGVVISDQINVVTTNRDGFYSLEHPGGYGIIFMSLPSGYTTKKSFLPIGSGNNSSLDFAVTKTQVLTEFKFIHASDTHISEKSIDRMVKLRRAADSLKADFVLISGDLIKDALRVSEKEASGLFELFVREIQKFKMPVWPVPGNHENFGIERHLSLVSPQNPLYGKKMYRKYLGPNYYSFNFGGFHFMGLDDVDFEDTWYFGHIDSVQLAWMRKDLAALPAGEPVITFAHMPFFSGALSLDGFTESGPGRTLERENGVLTFRHVVSNAYEALSVLDLHPYPLSLAGHMHARQIFKIEVEGQPVRYEQTGAVIGPSGEGPMASPSGITLYHVKNGIIDEGVFVRLDKKR